MNNKRLVVIALGLLMSLTACVREQPNIIIVTATIPAVSANDAPVQIVATHSNAIQQPVAMTPLPQQPLIVPTPDAPRPELDIPVAHTVQSGDTLSGIAAIYGVSLEALLGANESLDPNILSIGQVIQLPSVPEQYTPNFKIIPDSRLVRAPGSAGFDIASFINAQSGYIRTATDEVDIRIENGAAFPTIETSAQIVNRVAIEYSVDPRILLAILEFRAGWLSNPVPREDLLTRPLVNAELAPTAEGLYKQLSWLANELNRGYYAYKYRGLATLTLSDGTRLLFNPEINPGTVAVQYALSLGDKNAGTWQAEVNNFGLYQVYVRYFGDPFAGSIEPLVPSNIQQPQLALPFEPGVEWRFTGGPHGGWGSGSAWSALDFAPSEDSPDGVLCFVANTWLTAVAPGIISRAGEGTVVLDLDADGDESTGWSIHYLHLAADGMAQQGLRVNTGDRIGRPSCAGGFSSATHVHIGRRFNGEWLPADCQGCLPAYQVPPFTLGNWTTVGLDGQYYQGFLANGATQIQAEQGRQTTINIISG